MSRRRQLLVSCAGIGRLFVLWYQPERKVPAYVIGDKCTHGPAGTEKVLVEFDKRTRDPAVIAGFFSRYILSIQRKTSKGSDDTITS